MYTHAHRHAHMHAYTQLDAAGGKNLIYVPYFLE
jgi:hypothetical protein